VLIAAERKHPRPCEVKVKLLDKGASGDVLGVVHVVTHDASGRVTVTPRPFIMNERATLDLGVLEE